MVAQFGLENYLYSCFFMSSASQLGAFTFYLQHALLQQHKAGWFKSMYTCLNESIRAKHQVQNNIKVLHLHI